MDNGPEVALRKDASSHTFFVQTACRYIFGIDVSVDGEWGTNTDAALIWALDLLTIEDDISAPSVWREFLLGCAERAFEGVAPEFESVAPNPLVALRRVYDIIDRELGDTASRKTVESALTSFVTLDEIGELLDKYRTG